MSRLIQQRRGKGSPTYRNFKTNYHIEYPPNIADLEYTLVQFVHDAGKTAPVARYVTSTNISFYNIASIKSRLKEVYTVGSINYGRIKRLKDIPGGASIFNIQNRPTLNSKLSTTGKFARASGCHAQIIKVEPDNVTIKLGTRILNLPGNCLATIGSPGGAGKGLKPLLKAGTNVKRLKGCAQKAYSVSAKNKNHHEHPFGASKSKSPGRPKTSSRHAPPGAKVGSIAAKRTGRKKKH